MPAKIVSAAVDVFTFRTMCLVGTKGWISKGEEGYLGPDKALVPVRVDPRGRKERP